MLGMMMSEEFVPLTSGENGEFGSLDYKPSPPQRWPLTFCRNSYDKHMVVMDTDEDLEDEVDEDEDDGGASAMHTLPSSSTATRRKGSSSSASRWFLPILRTGSGTSCGSSGRESTVSAELGAAASSTTSSSSSSSSSTTTTRLGRFSSWLRKRYSSAAAAATTTSEGEEEEEEEELGVGCGMYSEGYAPPGAGMYTITKDRIGHHPRATPLDTVLEITKQAQLIAQSIGQAFQVAYMEFLKANGIDDPTLMKEIDYQEVLNQQEIFGEELYLFSNKEMQKEVIVPKLKTEALGVVIVESGWGSMVPTVVLANMSPTGAASRCGQLNIGDQIMSINGVSLVGLPLSSCQNYIKATRNQTVVKLTVVSCPPVVEVCIKRPDVKYQLGFSVQNGVICSLLRGGIAERGGVRVGHRIIDINGTSVVAVPHEKIVNMLATSVGEIHMKTMPTSIFRLLTGQETPHYI